MDIGLDDTAQAPALPPRDTVATAPPPLADGSRAPEAEPAAAAAPATRLRSMFVATAMLGAVNLAYFIGRFVISSERPALHPIFQTKGADLEVNASFMRGPYVTIASISVVAALFLGVTVWVAHHHRRDAMTQLGGALAILAGQISISVTLLTSADTFEPARYLAAAIYVLVPVGGFGALALFPSGKPVPRFALWLVPFGVVPYALQARLMFVERGYSVVLAGLPLPAFLAGMACQWYRYRRRATLREQHQIKWLSYAGAAFAAIQALAVAGILPLLADTSSAWFPLLKLLYAFLVAGSYVVAITCLLFSAARYRLWDVDRLINRTVVYALVTVLLAAAFAIGFFALRAALWLVHVPSAVAAGVSLAAVLAFFPFARRRSARWIDRRFYGIGLDYEAIAAKAVRAAGLPTVGSELGAFDGLVLLGKGGMGAVYRAHHSDFGVPVALKVMSPALAGDASAQARFQREARVLEGLRHPHVVPFLASGHDKGLAFIAMQYVDGEDLGTLVRRRGKLPAGEVATIVAGIAEALDCAHARGVVHRDVKPANVFLERGDPERALVMDFGVARLAGDPMLEGDDSLVGSLPYVAPEQIHKAANVDARADVYALGATAFELVCGRPPFVETSALAFVMAHLRQPAPDARELVPGLPAHVAAALARALAKRPEDRFASAGEFAAAFAGRP